VLSNHVSGLSNTSVSSSVLVNSMGTTSINSTVNSVSSHNVGNPSIPALHTAPLLNNGLGGKDTVQLPTSVTAASPASLSSSGVGNSHSNSITSLSSLSISSQSQSQANAMNSLSSSKSSEIMPGVMNGPLSAGGSVHDKVSVDTSDWTEVLYTICTVH